MHKTFGVLLIVFAWCCNCENIKDKPPGALQVFTVATEETDGFNRFKQSTDANYLDVKVLGMGEQWKGGEVRLTTGGGQKIKLFRKALEEVKDRHDLLVMFTDSYDVIITAPAEELMKRFLKFDAKVVFGAEGFCWPEQRLATSYPVVRSGKRYLNSGGFIGYAPEVYAIVAHAAVEDNDDDQLYYTKIFLDANLRTKYGIVLDTTSKIFQNLNGAQTDIELKLDPVSGKLLAKNMAYNTLPIVLHGNGPAKIALNWLGNYVNGAYSQDSGCRDCNKDTISLEDIPDGEHPIVLIAVFVEVATPFFERFLKNLEALAYNKQRIDLFIHCNVEYHDSDIKDFVERVKPSYRSVKLIPTRDAVSEKDARSSAVSLAISLESDFLFTVDSEASITTPQTLRLLIEQNRPILAPLLSRYKKLFSNYWGALDKNGYYARSEDYQLIVQHERKGVWNVPHISKCILIHKNRFSQLERAYIYDHQIDPDMSFSRFCRDHGYFQYVTNMQYFGHLLDTETFDTKMKHPDMYQIFENRYEWEQEYIHENFTKVLEAGSDIEQICPDVYWYPLFSEKFCWQLIDMMENFGRWSDGSNTDARLQGGYENVPTRDVHMNQVDYERHFLHILDEFVRPVQENTFIGYYQRPATAIMNFVVRYRPDEQPALRPHHDASTFTINVALNRVGVDYEGGGARFIRYDCAVNGTKQGWALMHPGRLTHLHEGLRTNSGTRYILVSFINP